MSQEIIVIPFPMQLAFIRMGTVNCYLIKAADAGYVLIDTAFPRKRADLDKALKNAGCHAGDLKLIILTHGDLDHIGNGAHLRRKHGAKIAIHRLECGVIEDGDATLSRKKPSALARFVFGIVLRVMVILARFGTPEKFRADFCLDEGDDLSGYGLNAQVIHLPGHSKGSIGIFTADGDLFCGDLLWNMSKPGPHTIIDDRDDFDASIKKLKHLNIQTVYPGHGKPFSWESFVQYEN